MEFFFNFTSNFDTLLSSPVLLEFQINICNIKGPDESFWFIGFCEDIQNPHVDGEMCGLRFPEFFPVFEQFSVESDQIVAGGHGETDFLRVEPRDQSRPVCRVAALRPPSRARRSTVFFETQFSLMLYFILNPLLCILLNDTYTIDNKITICFIYIFLIIINLL
jgi:hypothetical protein